MPDESIKPPAISDNSLNNAMFQVKSDGVVYSQATFTPNKTIYFYDT